MWWAFHLFGFSVVIAVMIVVSHYGCNLKRFNRANFLSLCLFSEKLSVVFLKLGLPIALFFHFLRFTICQIFHRLSFHHLSHAITLEYAVTCIFRNNRCFLHLYRLFPVAPLASPLSNLSVPIPPNVVEIALLNYRCPLLSLRHQFSTSLQFITRLFYKETIKGT